MKIEENLKTARTVHRSMLLVSGAILLFAYTTHLTQAYTAAHKEVSALVETDFNAFVTEGWDMHVSDRGGLLGDLGAVISMDIGVEDAFNPFSMLSLGPQSGSILEIKDAREADRRVRERIQQIADDVGLSLAPNALSRVDPLLPFESDPRRLDRPERWTLEEFYNFATSRKATQNVTIFVPYADSLVRAVQHSSRGSGKDGSALPPTSHVLFGTPYPTFEGENPHNIDLRLTPLSVLRCTPPGGSHPPRQCAGGKTEVTNVSGVKGVALAIAGTSFADWLLDQELGGVYAHRSADGLAVLKATRQFWSEVRAMERKQALAYLDKRATTGQELPVFGVRASGRAAILIGPIILFLLSAYLWAHVQRIADLSGSSREGLGEFPWIALYPGTLVGVSSLLTLALAPALACAALGAVSTYSLEAVGIASISFLSTAVIGVSTWRSARAAADLEPISLQRLPLKFAAWPGHGVLLAAIHMLLGALWLVSGLNQALIFEAFDAIGETGDDPFLWLDAAIVFVAACHALIAVSALRWWMSGRILGVLVGGAYILTTSWFSVLGIYTVWALISTRHREGRKPR